MPEGGPKALQEGLEVRRRQGWRKGPSAETSAETAGWAEWPGGRCGRLRPREGSRGWFTKALTSCAQEV